MGHLQLIITNNIKNIYIGRKKFNFQKKSIKIENKYVQPKLLTTATDYQLLPTKDEEIERRRMNHFIPVIISYINIILNNK